MSMKLIIAVVNSDDASAVLGGLSKAGYSATRLSTTGGFLRAGNVTLLIGVEEEKVDEVIALIGEYSSSRARVSRSLSLPPSKITACGKRSAETAASMSCAVAGLI